jgi:hypothetical protein
MKEIEEKESDVTTIVLVKKRGEQIEHVATGKCPRQHFRPLRGWELCHVVPFAVPSEYRFWVIRDTEKRTVDGKTIYMCLIERTSDS